MAGKKETKAKAKTGTGDLDSYGKISNSTDLKAFFRLLLDKMKDDSAAPIYVVGAMNHALTLPNIYEYLDNEGRELARDIWLRLKQSGLQVRNPPLLFGDDADGQAKA